MPCYSPLKGWLSNEVNQSGKRSVVFNKSSALSSLPVVIACGQCIGCRLERSRQWAIRCIHEASLYEKNCFITLTYNNEFLPNNGSLVKSHFQKFIKRLRKKFGSGVRYFQCGEYGSELSRPHYHACLFNFDFADKVLIGSSGSVKYYGSDILKELWSDPVTKSSYGFSSIGDVTFESAAYVARYILKKVSAEKLYPELKDRYYNGRLPEYITMSRRPGIGRKWLEEFKSDVFPHGFVVIRGGIKCKPPKYYENLFDLTNPEIYAKLKASREKKAFNDENNSVARLKVREFLQVERAKKLKRGFEC